MHNCAKKAYMLPALHQHDGHLSLKETADAYRRNAEAAKRCLQAVSFMLQ